LETARRVEKIEAANRARLAENWMTTAQDGGGRHRDYRTTKVADVKSASVPRNEKRFHVRRGPPRNRNATSTLGLLPTLHCLSVVRSDYPESSSALGTTSAPVSTKLLVVALFRCDLSILALGTLRARCNSV